MQRLSAGKLPRGELAEQVDVAGGCKRREHCSHLRRSARSRKLAVVVRERVVDHAEPAAGGSRIDLAGLHEVVPEDDRVTVAAVRARRKQVAWPDDRRASPSRVTGHAQLPFDICRIHAGSSARYARDDRRRPQVHEYVPCLPQYHGLVAADAVSLGDGDCGVDCAHITILDRRSRQLVELSIRFERRARCPCASRIPV